MRGGAFDPPTQGDTNVYNILHQITANFDSHCNDAFHFNEMKTGISLCMLGCRDTHSNVNIIIIIHLYCVNYGLCNVHYFEKCIVQKNERTIIAQ